MSSSQMISQHPFPSFPHPLPLPQQQSNKRGNRQFPKPKPPSHPFPLFWQFVAAKSLILCYLQGLFTVYIMPGTGNVSKKCAIRETGIQIEGYTEKKFRFVDYKKEIRFFWQKNEEMACILFRDGIQYEKCLKTCAFAGIYERLTERKRKNNRHV